MTTDNRLVLFEGVPGSGKTTTSQAVADALGERGQPCGWALEEDGAHPFFGSDVRRRHRDRDYDDQCLAQWETVIDRCRHGAWVLEGCAFQSTVRFMYEQVWPTDRIEDYWRRFADIVAKVDAKLVYFRHADVGAFVAQHTMAVRADVWEKISNHVASTPRGELMREADVDDVQIAFWTGYARLCDELVDLALVPALNLDVGRGWADVLPHTLRWLDEYPPAAGLRPEH